MLYNPLNLYHFTILEGFLLKYIIDLKLLEQLCSSNFKLSLFGTTLVQLCSNSMILFIWITLYRFSNFIQNKPSTLTKLVKKKKNEPI